MKWLFTLTKQRLRYCLFIFMIVIGDLSSILPPILFSDLINDFVANGNAANIEMTSLKIFLIIFFGSTSAFIGAIFINWFRTHMNSAVRNACYVHLNGLDRSFHYNNNIGEVTTLITSDLGSVGHFLIGTVKDILFVFLSFIVVLVYCLFVETSLTVLILLPAPIIAFLSIRHMKKVPSLYDERRAERTKINNYISESLDGIKVIRVLATEEKNEKVLRDLNATMTKKSMKLETVKQKYNIKVNILSESMNLILILFGGILLIKDVITLGDIVMFKSYMWMLKGPFARLAYYIDDYQEYKLSISKIKKLLSTKALVLDDGQEVLDYKNEVIVLDNVSVKFDGQYALRNVNLTIKPGMTFACIGEVGSGKSTIAKLLLRFIEPSEGRILIGGIDYKNFTLKSLRDSFGYVSQTPFLYSDTIKNNVNYGNLNLTDDEIFKYLKMAKADYIFSLEDGINTIIGENGVNLSGGEKQRLSLARALAKNPKVLILDDITSALDIETEVSVTENIEKLSKKITKIIIAQKVFSVKNADQILVFKDSQIIESGTHQELLRLNGEYKKIYYLNEGGEYYGN